MYQTPSPAPSQRIGEGGKSPSLKIGEGFRERLTVIKWADSLLSPFRSELPIRDWVYKRRHMKPISEYVITVDFEDMQLAEAFDQLPLWSAPFGQLLLEHVPLRPNLSVLDVGCGTGFPLLELAGRLGQSSQVVGLDIWQPALQRAKKKRDYFSVPHVSLVAYDGEGFPFGDASFDVITSNLGVNNFAKPLHAIRECYRVTQPGGQLVMTSNLVGHMEEFYEIFRQVLTDFGNTVYLERLNQQEAHRGTANSHQMLLREGGYEIEQVIQRSFIMRYANGTAFFQHPFIRLAFLPAWVSLIDEPDRDPIFSRIATQLNDHAETEDELRLTIPSVCIVAIKTDEGD